MGRRKDSILKDILDLTTMLPWWVGTGLAFLSYLIFHFIAGIQIEKAEGLDQFGIIFVKQLSVSMSVVLQYLIPMVFLLGALGSVFQRHKKNKLYKHVKQNPKIESLMEMNWQQFELLVGKYFEQKGYTVRQLAQPGPDGGVDLVATKEGEKYLVQCKQWRSTSVGVKVVRELLGAIAANGAVGGFVVASGQFTKSATDFVKGRNIELIDGAEIIRTVDDIADVRQAAAKDENKIDIDKPACPACGSAMKLRTAKKGANIGNQFWGCSTFPKCKGILNLNEL